MKNIKFKITLDEFFDLFYTHSKRLAIKGNSYDKGYADFLLGCALYEKGKKVNGNLCFDEWNKEPLPVLFRDALVYLNSPVDGSDLITEQRAKELGIIILNFYEVDCTKYLTGSWVFKPYGQEKYQQYMIECSKKMFKEREQQKIPEKTLVK